MTELTEREITIIKDCIHDSMQKIYRSDSRLIKEMSASSFAKNMLDDRESGQWISLIESNLGQIILRKNRMFGD